MLNMHPCSYSLFFFLLRKILRAVVTLKKTHIVIAHKAWSWCNFKPSGMGAALLKFLLVVESAGEELPHAIALVRSSWTRFQSAFIVAILWLLSEQLCLKQHCMCIYSTLSRYFINLTDRMWQFSKLDCMITALPWYSPCLLSGTFRQIKYNTWQTLCVHQP